MARLTPMQAHQMRVNAQQHSQQAAEGAQPRALKWLYDQTVILRGIQSTASKEAHKAQVLPEITPYLEGVMQADSGQPDAIFATCTVWAIDAACAEPAHWPQAMHLIAYAVRHALPMPDQFKRNAPTLVVDLCADAALAGRIPAAIAPQLLAALLDLTEGANMPDQSRAKNHKAIAYAMAGRTTKAGEPGDWASVSTGGLQVALDHLTEAERLDEKCGVKKDIGTVQKLLKARATPAETAAPPAPAPAPAAPAPAAKADGKASTKPAPKTAAKATAKRAKAAH